MWVIVVPPKISLKYFNLYFMKKANLKISKKSSVVRMSNCPKNTESQCGIMYRSM